VTSSPGIEEGKCSCDCRKKRRSNHVFRSQYTHRVLPCLALLALLGCRVKSTPEALVSVMQALIIDCSGAAQVTLDAASQAFGLVQVAKPGDKV